MKIGILTFHSQLNYGGVLQCWALVQALKGMGHEVVVVDRWHFPDNRMLRCEFADFSAKDWIKLLIRGLLGCGDFGKLMRTIRTIRFVRGLGLTKEHFCDWDEIKQLNDCSIKQLDLLVVGSDQVWHCGDWGDPRPYLLEGAPEIRAIAYAASFGLKSIPADMIDLYRRGFGRFSAISCREQEGVEICCDLGFTANHVVDPTLLVDPSEWFRLIKSNNQIIKQPNNVLVCYFMSIDLSATLPLLERFADKMNCTVEVLTNDQPMLKPMPRSLSAVMRNFCRRRVKICRGYGPKEFVKAFAGATWVLADSFHAVMFSSVFNCNARFVRPTNEMRRVMFARVEEFATKCISGSFFVNDVAQTLSSFAHGETIRYNAAQIAMLRAESKKWLMDALKGCC